MAGIRRSLHFVPGANERMLSRALTTAADALLLDLEDAVTPARKEEARGVVAGWLRDVDFGRQERIVRMNPLATPWGHGDLAEVMATPPDAFLVPKPETLNDLTLIDGELSRLERSHGHPPGKVELVLIAGETPLGALHIPTLTACPRVSGLSWGAEDLATAIGATRNRDEGGAWLPPFEHCRSMALLAAKAAGVHAIDAVYVDFRDTAGLARECQQGATLGFTGKLSIHPSQIDPINEAFTPDPAEVSRARELIEAFDEAQAKGRMAFTFDGAMVDAPHLARAKALVARAEAIAVAQ
ncbi:MAG: CoA ester lyase [Gammaproteobacteria bacterium]|nr:CoA ester lyase [Gammaproteobacteria bacterium]MYB37422.1 CoA ester lyase [Gammaproteobacteria bacterium]